MELSILIKTSLGLESVTKAELRDLGYREVQTADGEIRITGGAEDVVRLNLALRTAERVLIEVGRFEANDFDALFDQAEALPWDEYLPETAKIVVDGATSRSELKSVRTAQSMIKRAVANVLQKRYGISRLAESGAEYSLEFFFLKSQVSLALNTSGEGLHRRGYRKEAGSAPLRETLAAALVILSGWDEQGEFSDPFCGSGTIPIEAALMQRRIAPGLRRSFAAESWSLIPNNLWREQRAEFEAIVLPEGESTIVGSDVDANAVSIAKQNALRADLGGTVSFVQRDVFTFEPKDPSSVLVSNIPYGERMGTPKELERLYTGIRQLMEKYPKMQIGLLTADDQLEKHLKRRASRKRKLYNARIKTDYYLFS